MTNASTYLDTPIWNALTTHHAEYALSSGLACCYPADAAPFAAVAAPTAEAFRSLATLRQRGEVAALIGTPTDIGEEWELVMQIALVQMIYEGAPVEAITGEDAIVTLTPADIPAILELIDLTRPGPFFPRTSELGHYVGIWQNGRLAAMAGQRLYFPNYHEISAVCTHPDFQRRGYARALILYLMREIQREGDTPFLHVFSKNLTAQALYEKMGFNRRTEVPVFTLLRK